MTQGDFRRFLFRSGLSFGEARAGVGEIETKARREYSYASYPCNARNASRDVFEIGKVLFGEGDRGRSCKVESFSPFACAFLNSRVASPRLRTLPSRPRFDFLREPLESLSILSPAHENYDACSRALLYRKPGS